MEESVKRPTVAFRLVLIEWEDSAKPVSDWQWVTDYKLPKAVRCVSVGYLISDIGNSFALAPNLGDIDQPEIQASGIIRIPKRSVTSMADV